MGSRDRGSSEVRIGFSGSAFGTGMALLPDGRILVAGVVEDAATRRLGIGLARCLHTTPTTTPRGLLTLPWRS